MGLSTDRSLLVTDLLNPDLTFWEKKVNKQALVDLVNGNDGESLRFVVTSILACDRVKPFQFLLDNALVKACDLLNLPLLNDVIQARAYNCFKLLCQKIPKEYLVKTSVIQPVSAVHLAAQNGAHKILKFILTSLFGEIMPENIVDQYNRTPLHYAATSGNKLCCEECLEFGFPVDGRDKFGQTPIMFAATNTDIGIIKLLANKKPSSLSHRSKFGSMTVYHIAVAANNIAGLSALLEIGGNVNNLFDENNRTVLHYAALYDRTECIQILLKHKANRNALDKVFACPAHYAAQNSLGALKLLTAGVNEDLKDNEGRTTFMYAVLAQNYTIVKAYLDGEIGINVNLDGIDFKKKSALHLAAVKGDEEICKLLVNRRGQWEMKGDQNSATPIHLAAGAGHTGLLQFFKRASIDINIEDGEKKTPLLYACLGGMSHTVQVLIEELNADVNHCDVLKQNALHCAVFAGSLPCVQILWKKNCDSNQRSLKGETPYELAENLGKKTIIKWFEEEGHRR